ncbi:MAG: hypothetical protein N2645_19840 [Clostridia bacterium]|nr:hypothetical protein [Clostridia bacterium]
MKRRSFFACILVSLLVMIISGCGKQQVAWESELSNISKENKYTLLYIDDGSSKDNVAIRDSIKESVNSMPEQFKFVEVNYNKNKDALLKYLKTTSISKFPLALSIAPNGAVTGSFDKKCTVDELKATVCSNKECDTLLCLQKGNVALICIHKGQTEEFNKVKSELKAIETNFSGVVVAQYIDTEDKNNADFIKKLPETTANLTVFITVPGQGIKAKLEGDQINNKNLLQAIQSSCSSGSCGTGGCN